MVEYPEYDQAFNQFIYDTIRELMHAKDPVFAKVPLRPTESRGANIVGGGKNDVELQPIPMETSLLIPTQIVRDTDVDGFLAAIEDSSDKALESFMPEFFKRLEEACPPENTIDAKGRKFSADMLIDMFERVEFAFDQEDNPVMPTIVGGPGLSLPPLTPEQTERLNQVLARKKAEHLAKKRVRKLR